MWCSVFGVGIGLAADAARDRDRTPRRVAAEPRPCHVTVILPFRRNRIAACVPNVPASASPHHRTPLHRMSTDRSGRRRTAAARPARRRRGGRLPAPTPRCSSCSSSPAGCSPRSSGRAWRRGPSIIGVFLAGIALGNALGGQARRPLPHPADARGAARASGRSPPCGWSSSRCCSPRPGCTSRSRSGVRIPVLAAVLCLPAGFVLSLLTPLAIKLGLPDVRHTGRVAGLIFAPQHARLPARELRHRLLPDPDVHHQRARVRRRRRCWCWRAVAAGRRVVLTKLGDVRRGEGGRARAADRNRLRHPARPRSPPARSEPARVPRHPPRVRRSSFLASFGGMTLELTASRRAGPGRSACRCSPGPGSSA